MERLDDWLHRCKCRLYEGRHMRLFRALRVLSKPICRRVSLMDHVR